MKNMRIRWRVRSQLHLYYPMWGYLLARRVFSVSPTVTHKSPSLRISGRVGVGTRYISQTSRTTPDLQRSSFKKSLRVFFIHFQGFICLVLGTKIHRGRAHAPQNTEQACSSGQLDAPTVLDPMSAITRLQFHLSNPTCQTRISYTVSSSSPSIKSRPLRKRSDARCLSYITGGHGKQDTRKRRCLVPAIGCLVPRMEEAGS